MQIICNITLLLRKDSIAKFRNYQLVFHFLRISQSMSILKALKAITVNSPTELSEYFQSYLSKDFFFMVYWTFTKMNLKTVDFSKYLIRIKY